MAAGIVIFVVAILVIIMIHEYGHFAAAKLLGFKAPKFFVGFGPTIWSITRGETEYGIKALPIGGFVKIEGMNPYEEIAPADQHRAYSNRPKWARAIVIAAGSATHWVVAFVILVVTAMTIGFPTGGATTKISGVETVVGKGATQVFDNGFQAGDHIVAINGRSVDKWSQIRAFIRGHGDQSEAFTVLREGDRRVLDVRIGEAVVNKNGSVAAYAAPGKDSLPKLRKGQQRVGFLGVASSPEYVSKPFVPAVTGSAGQVWDLTKRSVVGIGQIFSMIGSGDLWSSLAGSGPRSPTDSPTGIVGAGRIAGQSTQSGNWIDLIGLIVGFCVFVGLMNLLPLPPLDGGHLAVVAYEAVTGRKVDIRRLVPVAAAVISFFVLLSVAVLYLDLARPIQSPF